MRFTSRYVCSFIAAVCASNFIMGTASASLPLSADSSWFMGVGGGNTWINLSNNDYILNASGASPPYNYDKYSVNGQQTPVFQYLIGYRWYRDASYLPYYSLATQYSHFFRSHISGTDTQFTVPPFENYNYLMSYTADMFVVNGKFDLVQYYAFLPYLSVGIGAIFNHVNGYSESALANVTPRTSPGYQGNSQTKLAATLGAGLDVIVSKNYWLTLGYEHVFQGDLRSGQGTGAWSNTALNFGNVKMDTAFVALTANFPQGFRG